MGGLFIATVPKFLTCLLFYLQYFYLFINENSTLGVFQQYIFMIFSCLQSWGLLLIPVLLVAHLYCIGMSRLASFHMPGKHEWIGEIAIGVLNGT